MEKLTKSINVRLTEKEWKAITSIARAQDLSASELVRAHIARCVIESETN